MSLFIELYLDEDVDILIADLLKAHDFSALTNLQREMQTNFRIAMQINWLMPPDNRGHFLLIIAFISRFLPGHILKKIKHIGG